MITRRRKKQNLIIEEDPFAYNDYLTQFIKIFNPLDMKKYAIYNIFQNDINIII